jgi:ABC-2 type transport system permease protein
MKPVMAVFKREFAAYFATPLAYVFIVIFLLAMGAFTFYVGHFYDNGVATLSVFFGYHPWLYLFSSRLSACGYGRRNGAWER